MCCPLNIQTWATVAFLSAFLSCQAMGQAGTGSLRGRVFDSHGRALEGAQLILLVGTSGDATATTVSDRFGYFEFTRLPASRVYRLRVIRHGDVSVEASGLPLAQGETKELRITLDPRRAVANAVAEVPPAEERQEVSTLPVRGQASGTLEMLIPGSTGTGPTLAFPVNGSRPQFNTYIVSGGDNLDPFRGAKAVGQGGAFAAPAVLLPLDAIQEIELQTNTTAEYGPSGAAVLTVTKSGGPQLHGSLFEFFDNDKLAANNFYNNAFGQPRPEFRNNQYGFTAGGPLPYRSYFFSSYEGQHERVGVTAASRFPTQAEIATATSLVEARGRSVNPLAARILALYPASLGQGPLSFSVIGRSDGNATTLKADHSAGRSNSVSVFYALGANHQSFPQGHLGLGGGSRLPLYVAQSHTVVHLFAAVWQGTISPHLLNAARLGYTRYAERTFPGDHSFDVTSIGLNTGVTSARDFGLPEIDIAPGAYENLGASLSLPHGRASNVFEFSDGLGWNAGAHQWKFGGSATFLQENAFSDAGMRGRLVLDGSQLGDQLTPDFAIASLADLLTGLPAPGVTTIARGDSQRYLRQRRWAVFAEDGGSFARV